jgi:hypothetical protein
MDDNIDDSVKSLDKSYALIVRRLQLRRMEIEQAIYLRVCVALSDPIGKQNPKYERGMRNAVTEVVGCSLAVIAEITEWLELTASVAASQARRAVLAGVSLGLVQRCYIIGHAELNEFIWQESRRAVVSDDERVFRHFQRMKELLLDYITAATEREYDRAQIASKSEKRRAEIVQRLLAEEPVDPSELAELDYHLHACWHVGVIAAGPGAHELIRRLSASPSEKRLVVSRDTKIWMWYSGPQRISIEDVEHAMVDNRVDLLATGEPGMGIDGWRLTHHQAQAALGVALYKLAGFARYEDHRLLAAVLQDDTLAKSLKQRYLAPFDGQRDGGAKLRQTLRAHIDAGCIASSAAPILKVDRHTVEDRVRTAERLLGCPLRACLSEMDVALRVEELEKESVLGSSSRSP